jgi:hypothetical protein
VVVKYSEQDSGYILIDGQQRVTTSLLLLAAIRHLTIMPKEKAIFVSSIVDLLDPKVFWLLGAGYNFFQFLYRSKSERIKKVIYLFKFN